MVLVGLSYKILKIGLGNRKLKRIIKCIFKYVLRVLLLLFATTIIAFTLVSLSPVDPVQQYVLGSENVGVEQREKIAEYWGLNDKPVNRYINWLSSVIRGDLGISLIYRQPVINIIGEKFVNSFVLMVISWSLSGIIGFTLGCLMGMFQNKLIDKIIKKLCFILSSIPVFWIGMIFILIFSVRLNWFPIGFSSPIGITTNDVTILQKIHHLILPAFTLTFVSFSNIALHTRQKLIDVLSSNYVIFAKARGESKYTILKRHGIRNILLPAITLQFNSFTELFSGSVLAETVFSYPGLGSAVSEAGLSSDIPLLLGITLISSIFVFTGNLIADISYGVIDPRIREELKNG